MRGLQAGLVYGVEAATFMADASCAVKLGRYKMRLVVDGQTQIGKR